MKGKNMPEKFNPNKFKSYKELPKDRKMEFEKVDNGFVGKEAADHFRKLQKDAKAYNKGMAPERYFVDGNKYKEFSRSFIKRILGRDKVKATDIAFYEAKKIDPVETAKVEIGKIKESMPEELKEKLKTMIFSAHEEASYSDQIYDYKVTGLKNAIDAAIQAGASYDYNTDNAITELKYDDNDTQVNIVGWTNGWESARPSVSIKHKGQEFSWVEMF